MLLNVKEEAKNSDIPEEEIIRKAQEGNAEAFEQLYRRYSRRVYSICLRIVKNDGEAEDLTQEAFLLLFRKVHTFRGEAKFSTWLHRLTINLVFMGLRKKRYPQVSLDAAPEPGEEDSTPLMEHGGPDLQLTGMLDHVNLSKAIEQLPDGYKEIFILHDVEGYEHHEIAEILGCSAGNSKSQLYKARLRLRESLQEALRSDAREKRISHSTNCLFRNIKTLDSCPLKPESNGAGNEERRKARNRSLGVWTRCVEHVDSGCSNTPGPRSVRCVLRVRKCLTQAG